MARFAGRNPENDFSLAASGHTRHADAVVRLAFAVFALMAAGAVVFAAFALAGQSEGPQQQGGGTVVEPTSGEADAESRFERGAPSIEPPYLVGLLGMEREQALAAIGHGASVSDENMLQSGGETRTRLVVALAAERAKDQPGAPVVHLVLDGQGRVVEARYSAALRSFGFSNRLSFTQAVDVAHVVEAALADVGMQVDAGAVTLPDDAASYSTWRDDGRTLERQHADFSGVAQQTDGSGEAAWTASLDYDFADAIEAGNLVYTHRILEVGVSSA